MSSVVQVRQVSYGHPDVVALTALAQQYYVAVYGSPDETPVSAEEFAPPNGDFLVGYVGDGAGSARAVAMGGWRFTDAAVPGARRPAELKRMFVVDDQRGLGLARLILATVESSAHAAGADHLLLETGTPQVGAIALYRSAGYTDAAPFGHYAESDSVVTLGRPLGARSE